jgi:hypothetical protein
MAISVRRNHALTAYRERVEREVPALVAEYAAKIDDQAKAAAPVKSGTLRRSISHEVFDGGWSARIGSRGVPYARIQDLGGQTSNQYGPNSGRIRGNRYLTGTRDRLVREFHARLARVLKP